MNTFRLVHEQSQLFLGWVFFILGILKMSLIAAQYDSLYASKDGVFGSGKPLPIVAKLPEYLSTGTVLDVGGGEGQNALFLAHAGFAVTVVDLSQVGLNKLAAAAEQAGLPIKTKVSDVTEEGIAGEYDGMLCTFMLHHVSQQAAVTLIKNMQQHTRAGGVHALTTFVNQGGLYERNKKSASGRFYPSVAEVRALYAGWKIHVCVSKEITTHAKDKQGNPFTNHMIVFIAQKCI